MYSATFAFGRGDYDDESTAATRRSQRSPRRFPDIWARKPWGNPATGLISTVYYWQTLEALQQLVEHPQHRAAKDLQSRWIRGYHITVAQVLRSYGDGGIAHPLAHASGFAPAAGQD